MQNDSDAPDVGLGGLADEGAGVAVRQRYVLFGWGVLGRAVAEEGVDGSRVVGGNHEGEAEVGNFGLGIHAKPVGGGDAHEDVVEFEIAVDDDGPVLLLGIVWVLFQGAALH